MQSGHVSPRLVPSETHHQLLSHHLSSDTHQHESVPNDAPGAPLHADELAASPPLVAAENVRALHAARRAREQARTALTAKAKGPAQGRVAAGRSGDEEDDDGGGDPHAPVHALPPEVLMRILSHLDPVSLAQTAAVCQSWAAVARDDASWRLAFSVAFGLDAAGEDNKGKEDEATVPCAPALRRLERASWKLEYARRTELLRRWRKSRSPTVLSDPRIATLHSIALAHPHHFMLSTSLAYGVAARSDPFTGKVSKGYIDAAGQINGAGIGNPNAEFAPDATAVTLEADASRVVWGFRGGEVGMTMLSRQGNNPRGTIKSTRFSPRGGHPGGVTDVALPFRAGRGGVHSASRSIEKMRARQAAMGDTAETFATAGYDGTVRLWSPRRPLPLWTGSVKPPQSLAPSAASTGRSSQDHPSAPPQRSRPAPVACVEYDPASGTIAAGTSEGRVVIWKGIDVAALLSIPAMAWERSPILSTDSSPALVEAREIHAKTVAAVRRFDIAAPPRLAADQDPAVCQLDLDRASEPSAGHARSTQKEHGMLPDLSSTTLLVRHVGFPRFYRHEIQWGTEASYTTVATWTYVVPGKGEEITALRADFDCHRDAPVSSRESLQPPSRASPRIPASGSSGAAATTLVLGPPRQEETAAGGALFAERKFVCGGSKSGGLYVWDWDTKVESSGEARASIEPTLTLEGHTTTITALDFAEHVIVAGSNDGTLKAFCALTGRALRTFNERTATRHPARMLAAGQLTVDEAARFLVRQVIVTRETIIAAIGHQVLAWKAELVRKRGAAGRKSSEKGQRGHNGLRTWDAKFQARADLKQDLSETHQLLAQERERTREANERLRYAVGPPQLGGLDDQEALDYAIMLSRDAEEARASKQAGLSKGEARDTAAVEEEDELEQALAQIAQAESLPDRTDGARAASRSGTASNRSASSGSLSDHGGVDFEGGDYYDDSVEIYSASPSPSPGPSPSLRGVATPSRAWDIVRNAGPHGISSPEERWRPNSKVRTIQVPRSARLASSSSNGGPSGRHSSGAEGEAAPPGLENASHWPGISPTSQSPGLEAWSLDSSRRRPSSSMTAGSAWHSALSRSPAAGAGAAIGSSSSASPSVARPLGAWASGSPALRPADTAGSSSGNSLLSSSRPGGHADARKTPSAAQPAASSSREPAAAESSAAATSEDMDDDLRFALELSLAEERSRGDK